MSSMLLHIYNVIWKPLYGSWFCWCTEDRRSVRTKLEVTMYSRYTAHLSSTESHFLLARLLTFYVYCTYKVSKSEDYGTKLEVTMYFRYAAHITGTAISKFVINRQPYILSCRGASFKNSSKTNVFV